MDRKTKIAFFISIVLHVFTVILYAENLRQLKREQDLRDARAAIQLIAVKIHIERGDLSKTDLQILRDNWQSAEYDQVMPLSALENK